MISKYFIPFFCLSVISNSCFVLLARNNNNNNNKKQCEIIKDLVKIER